MDLKPQNILLTSYENPILKIAGKGVFDYGNLKWQFQLLSRTKQCFHE